APAFPIRGNGYPKLIRRNGYYEADTTHPRAARPDRRADVHARREPHPFESSVTRSRSGHLVALTRRRTSARSDSGTFTGNGRIAPLRTTCPLPCRGTPGGVIVAVRCSLGESD